MKKNDLAYFNRFTIEGIAKLYLVKLVDPVTDRQKRVSVKVIKKIYDNKEDVDVIGMTFNLSKKQIDSPKDFFAKSHKLIHWIFTTISEKQ